MDVLANLRSQLAHLVQQNNKLNDRIVALESSVLTRVSVSEELIQALTPAILEIAGRATGHLADKFNTVAGHLADKVNAVETTVANHVTTTAILATTVSALQKAVPVVIEQVAETLVPLAAPKA